MGSAIAKSAANRLGPGRLVLVVGPSGAGKDTLMNAVRTRMASDPGYHFARRLITRTPDIDAEDHDAISPDDYARMAEKGEFALSWRAHGLGYGLPRSIDTAIRDGRTVIANGSRKIIPAAEAKYDNLLVLLITAPREILAERLRKRGRETAEEIERRLDRAELDTPLGKDTRTVANTGSIEDGVRQIMSCLEDRG